MIRIRPISFLILAFIFQGCATRNYGNSEAFLLRPYSCPVSENYTCEFKIKNLEVKYLVLKNDHEYTIHGRARWDNADESLEVVEIGWVDVFFVFFDPERVVLEQKERIRGGRVKHIPFTFKINSEKDISSSALAGYRARVR